MTAFVLIFNKPTMRKTLTINALLFIFTVCFFWFNYSHIILSENLFEGMRTGDPEVNAFISYQVKNGGKLYEDFSILYGPGRYFLVAGLNSILGIDYSTAIFNAYFLINSYVIFPTFLVLLLYNSSVFYFSKEGTKWNLLLSFVSIFFAYLYTITMPAAQEIHVFLVLFFIVYLFMQETKNNIVPFFAGVCLGLISFVRVEIAIIVTLSLVLTELFPYTKDTITKQISSLLWKFFLSGFFLFSLAYVLLLMLHGSLINFLHDIFWLAFIASPKQMFTDILLAHFPIFTFYLTMNAFMFLIAYFSRKKIALLVCCVNFFLFVSALGRSDYHHLHYSIVLFFPCLYLCLLVVKDMLFEKEKQYLRNSLTLSMGLIVFLVLCVFFVIRTESSSFLLGTGLCIALIARYFRQNNSLLFILGFCIILLPLYTGLSYFNRALTEGHFRSVLDIPQKILYMRDAMSSFAHNMNRANFGGQIIPQEEFQEFSKIKKDINTQPVFIYPTNVSMYYELSQQPPTRYLFFNGERTTYMENETIASLDKKKIPYVLYFESYALGAPGKIDSYIKDNYTIQERYFLDNNNVFLMGRKNNSEGSYTDP